MLHLFALYFFSPPTPKEVLQALVVQSVAIAVYAVVLISIARKRHPLRRVVVAFAVGATLGFVIALAFESRRHIEDEALLDALDGFTIWTLPGYLTSYNPALAAAAGMLAAWGTLEGVAWWLQDAGRSETS